MLPEHKWIACGSSDSRLELFGKTNASESNTETIYGELIAISGIRLFNQTPAANEEDAIVCQIDIDEIELTHPIVFEKEHLRFLALSAEKLIIEGFEGPENKFMDVLEVAGWKLMLSQANEEVSFGLYMLSDWNIDAHPDYFPGDTLGEIAITGTFGGEGPGDIGIDVPWPMSTDGKLTIGIPKRKEGRWVAPLDLTKVMSLFDGAGALMKDFPFGSLDLSSIKDAVGNLVDAYDDFITVETGADERGRMFFNIVVGPPDQIDIAEFGGLKLALLGDANIIISSTFNDDHIELALKLYLSNNAGLLLHGPFIRKIEGAVAEAKEIMSMVPASGLPEIPEFPDLQISFQLGEEPFQKTLASANLPLTWDFLPGLNPVSSLFSGIPLNIDPSQLVGFKFGSLDGDAPQVELKITNAEFHENDTVYGIKFYIELNVKIDSGDPIPFQADWLFTLDTETMSFDPAASLNIHTSFREFTVAGLTVTGLDTLMVSFEAGNMKLTASKLRAYYGGISEGDDGGFEMEVSNLLIDGGGIDMELFLKGGVTKVAGIGESFKGAEGKVVFSRSRFQSGYIKAEGPLPWMDNATGSIALSFKEGFELDRVQADFQLGVHHKTDWWVELDLQSVNIDIHKVNGNLNLILMVTGKISIVPPEGEGGFILSHLKSVNLEFKDLVLTKAFDNLPPGIKLSIVLAKPVSVDLLGIFGFEMRSIGIGSGFGEGQAALTIGGQVFFSSNDLQNNDPEFHKFKIGKPKPNELLPQIAFENLSLDFSFKPTLAVTGAVDYKDTPEWKGFKGHGKLTISKTIHINVILEFATVLREPDKKKLRVWMVYAEWENIDIKFISDFYLRDLGVGFGWRKTLHAMNDPSIVINNPSKGTMTVGPHLPSSWAYDLEGDQPRWTVVLSAWMTYGLEERNKPTPLVGDILLGLRSDLTILISMRGWIFGVLDEVKSGSGGLRPSIIGLLYYSAKNRHFLANYTVDPSAANPKGVPPALVKALIKSPFSFVLETKPDLFRLELGWPRQLTFPLGAYTGKAGFLMRTTSNALTIGISFEIAIDHEYNFGFSFGIGSIGIYIKIYIGIYGLILARIGHRPALYGMVGINALIIIDIRLSVNFKLAFIRIKFSIGVSITIVISARVEFGVCDAGFGMEGYASASLRIWKFSFGATVSFAINKPALDTAKAYVYEGVTAAGNEEGTDPKVRFLSEPLFELPPPTKPTPRWRTMPVKKGEFIYLLLLPEEDSWFACPYLNTNGTYKNREETDYQITFELKNVAVQDTADDVQITASAKNTVAQVKVPWNKEVSINTDSGEESKEKFKLGSLYYESAEVQQEHELIDRLLEDPYFLPELLTDWRVRTEEGAKDGMDDDMEMRPDVRSPKFSANGSIYDLALEEAFRYGKDDVFSWQALTVAQTRWTEEVVNRPEVMEFLFGEGYVLPTIDPNDEKQVYGRRKTLLDAMENMRSIRSGLSGTLLREFKTWINSNTPLEELEVLKSSGLAYRFKILDTSNFSLDVNAINIDRGYEKSQSINSAQIEQSRVDQDKHGVGFEKEGLNYRLEGLLEFQDQQGIHFSWELECETETGASFLMTEKESSGLQEEHTHFEYFDHYLVERINLSSESQETGYTKWEVKPGFVPALVDIGDGNRNFYLLAPRFDFSDLLNVPLAVGDQLIYRITAVDVFGNHSQTLEYLTSRKHLEAPPPPDNGSCDYEVQLTENGIEKEQLTINITESKEMVNWNGSAVRYEVWTKAQQLSSGGYFGLGDDVEETGGDDEKPVIAPKGMRLVGVLNKPHEAFVLTQLEGMDYGYVHTFFVRAISKEGNASRLIRCEHATAINATPKKKYANLERIPPPSNEVVEWVDHIDIRGEVLPYVEPILNDHSHQFTHQIAAEEAIREVSVKLLHNNYVDEQFRYPTGGYEVYMRDRDASTSDKPENYRKQLSIEVLSSAVYGISPYNTTEFSKWKSNFAKASEQVGVERVEGYLHWGEEILMATTDGINGFTKGLQIHARLREILLRLQKWATENKLQITIHGGGVSEKAMELISFDGLAGDFDLEKDPFGMGLLTWMGRTVDLAIYRGNKIMREEELFDVIGEVTTLLSDYQLTLELLLNNDRQTPMRYYRLGLHPVVKQLSMAEDPDVRLAERSTQQNGAFENFRAVLQQMGGAGKTLGGFDKAGVVERYLTFTDRIVQSRGISNETALSFGISWFNDQGDMACTVSDDDSLAFKSTYEEPLARRLAYRIKRIGRYYPLYRQLGLIAEADNAINEKPLLLRLPRVEVPRVPTVEFQGNRLRDGIQCTEWLIRQHEEEAMVQANETLRNRLGYRSLAWSLYTTVKPGWRQWSGWNGDDNWFTHSFDEEETSPLTEQEINTLEADARWTGDSSLKPDASLKGHPFTELLEPKGMVIRVPELPFYYQYRLAAFARADDVDSAVKMTDVVASLPSAMPQVNTETSGWSLHKEEEKIEIWWKIPSVWESFTKTQLKQWKNEEPFAKRLWDFDLKFTLQIRRSGVIMPLLYIQAEAVEDGSLPDSRSYVATTAGSYLFDKKMGKVEKLDLLSLKSKFDPELRLSLNVDNKLARWISIERNFILELVCTRSYGHSRLSGALLTNKRPDEVTP